VSAIVLSGRRRRRLVLLAALGVVVLAGTALWALLPGVVAIGHTDVLLDAKPFVCKAPADVTTFDSEDGFDSDSRVVVPAIRMHPGLDCTMTVVVRNDGDAEVAVDSVTLPLAGPQNAIGIRADHAFTQGFGPTGWTGRNGCRVRLRG
jgi:hypothetical protein